MKRLTRNVVIALITKVLLIISGIIAQRFILVSFGSQINGLTSSIIQFMSYFALLEAGLGTASIQALYKPLSDNDYKKANEILAATSFQYRNVGFVFAALTLVLSFAMPYITNSTLSDKLIIAITLLMGMSNVLNYSLIGRYQVLLNADRHINIVHSLDAVLGISFAVIRILMINGGCSIILVQTAALLSPLIRLAVLRIYVKKHYAWIDYSAKSDNKAISKRWSVLVHQIVGMVTNHTDITILTLASSLNTVSVYSVYNYIYSNISALISTAFATAPLASFGRLIEKKDPNLKTYFHIYETLFTFFVYVIICIAVIMTIPFVTLYTRGVTDASYIDQLLAVLFAVSILFSLIRIPAIIMINAYGFFKETQKGAIIEAVLNICISIPAFFIMGMRGLLLGTCIAMGYRAIDIIVYTYRFILKEKIRKIIILNTICIILALLFYTFFIRVCPVVVTSWWQWLIWLSIVLLSSCLWFSGAVMIFYKNQFKAFVKYLRRSVR